MEFSDSTLKIYVNFHDICVSGFQKNVKNGNWPLILVLSWSRSSSRLFLGRSLFRLPGMPSFQCNYEAQSFYVNLRKLLEPDLDEVARSKLVTFRYVRFFIITSRADFEAEKKTVGSDFSELI